jgi:hypothetical protein
MFLQSRRQFKLLCLSFLFLIAVSNAQTNEITKRTCATAVPDEAWNNWFNSKVEEFKANSSAQKDQSANYTIPVVFHVLHGGESVGTFPNISQNQINSQIAILNDDYAGTGLNVGNFSNTNFNQSLIANCNVRFCLAERDPSGTILTEKGIHRIDYNSYVWASPTSYTSQTDFRNFMDNIVKPNTIWDANRYLNIWMSDVNTNVGLLGYATFPPSSTLNGISGGLGSLTNDGVWCWAKAIGDVGTLPSFYNKGRTATHEVGHYLGLRHIWGDANCGDDFCNDTPTQQKENTGCPAYPHTSCNNAPNGDLFMNFMDYSYDNCLYMFTNDQRARMQTAMLNSPLRMQLSASAATLCNTIPTACSYTVSNFSNVDTLFSYRRVTASSTDNFCPQGPGLAGYISGTNCYADKEKAEFYPYSSYSNVTDPYVTGVIVLFFQYGNLGTDGTGNVGINIYSGTSATAQPGALLGSTVANLSTIAASTNTTGVSYCGNPNLAFNLPVIMPYKFDFTNDVSVPQKDGFFVSVVLPTGLGDTVCIMDKNNGVTNTAWEKWSDDTWHDMRTAWGGTRNYNLTVLPIMECAVVGLKKNVFTETSVKIFPNPSTGNFTILTNFKDSQTIHTTIYNSMGQVVFKEAVKDLKENKMEVDMRSYATGIYFVELTSGAEKVVKKVVLER